MFNTWDFISQGIIATRLDLLREIGNVTFFPKRGLVMNLLIEKIEAEQFKKDIETQNTIKRKQIVIYTFLFALTLLLILVIIVFKNNKQRFKLD